MEVDSLESGDARRARYARMAIAAAVAAARARLPEVRAAYLMIAESWSDLAKREHDNAGVTTHEEKAFGETDASEQGSDFGAGFEY